MLDDCTLCDQKEDPRWGMTVDGERRPLCDGCGPDYRDTADIRRVADLCRAKGPRESATAKLIREVEIDMAGAYGRILAVTDERDFPDLIRRLDLLAHERLLAIRCEAARVAGQPPPIAVLVSPHATGKP